MPQIDAADLEFLRRVDTLAREGMTGAEIARRLDMPLPTLRSKIGRVGFQLTPAAQLRTILSGEPLAEVMGTPVAR